MSKVGLKANRPFLGFSNSDPNTISYARVYFSLISTQERNEFTISPFLEGRLCVRVCVCCVVLFVVCVLHRKGLRVWMCMDQHMV